DFWRALAQHVRLPLTGIDRQCLSGERFVRVFAGSKPIERLLGWRFEMSREIVRECVSHGDPPFEENGTGARSDRRPHSGRHTATARSLGAHRRAWSMRVIARYESSAEARMNLLSCELVRQCDRRG